MRDWYHRRTTDVGLRLTGVLSCAMAWLSIRGMFDMHIHTAIAVPSLLEYALATAGFVCGGSGGALIVLGRHIFDEIEVSERWRRYSLPERTGGSPIATAPDAPLAAPVWPSYRERVEVAQRASAGIGS